MHVKMFKLVKSNLIYCFAGAISSPQWGSKILINVIVEGGHGFIAIDILDVEL